MSDDTPLEMGISTAGTVLAACLFSAQLPAMYFVAFRGAPISKLSFLPTIGQAGNFAAWVVYGLFANESAVLRVNVIGCGFAAFYVLMFLIYSTGAARLRIAGMAASAVVVLAALFAGCIFIPQSHDDAVSALGWAAFGLNTIMYASPIAAVYRALATMDRGAIPILLTLSGLGCSALWGVYGLLKSNIYVGIPNGIGIVLSSLQLLVAAYVLCGTRGGLTGYGKVADVGEDDADEHMNTDGLSFADDASTVAGSVSGTLDRGLLQ